MKLPVRCFKIKAKERVLVGLPGGTCFSSATSLAEHHPEPEPNKIPWEVSGQLNPCSSRLLPARIPNSPASSARSPSLQSSLLCPAQHPPGNQSWGLLGDRGPLHACPAIAQP